MISLRRESVLCVSNDGASDIIIREFSIIKVKIKGDNEVTGMLRNIKDDSFDIDCSKQYSSNTYKVFRAEVESIDVINKI